MLSSISFFSLLFLLVFTACEKQSLAIKREWVGRNSLASTYVGSPDPRQKDPPRGQKLFMRWNVPSKMLEEEPTLILSILFRDLSEEKIYYPLDKKKGYAIYELLGEKYRKTKGFLSYKAEIVSQEGKVLKQWQHLLWAQLITVDDKEGFLSEIDD